MSWVYKKVKDQFVVGYYQPDGTWSAVQDFSFEVDARKLVHYLNGGNPP